MTLLFYDGLSYILNRLSRTLPFFNSAILYLKIRIESNTPASNEYQPLKSMSLQELLCFHTATNCVI